MLTIGLIGGTREVNHHHHHDSKGQSPLDFHINPEVMEVSSKSNLRFVFFCLLVDIDNQSLRGPSHGFWCNSNNIHIYIYICFGSTPPPPLGMQITTRIITCLYGIPILTFICNCYWVGGRSNRYAVFRLDMWVQAWVIGGSSSICWNHEFLWHSNRFKKCNWASW